MSGLNSSPLSKPIAIQRTKNNRKYLMNETMTIGSPRLSKTRKIQTQTKNPNFFVGSLQESLLSGRMSLMKSTSFSGFSGILTASSPNLNSCPNHLCVPFDAHCYHSEDHDRMPYAASIQIPNERFRISSSGVLQMTLCNPNNTPIKIFVVHYDLSSMTPNSKTVLRQITQTVSSHILQYAIQFVITRTKHRRFYINNSIRVVFPHRLSDESVEVLCNSPKF